MLDADILSRTSSAIADRDFWDTWGDRATVAVALGVILEAIVGFKTLAKLLHIGERSGTAIAQIGVLILVAGLLGEIKTGRELRSADERITAVLISELREVVGKNRGLEKALDRQGRKIVAADTRLGNLAVRANELENSFNGLHSRAEHEFRRIGPRHIDPELQKADTARLRNFAGTTFNLRVIPGDEDAIEVLQFADILRDKVLIPAGWTGPVLAEARAPFAGVYIRYRNGAPARVVKAATMLQALLRDAGVEVWRLARVVGDGDIRQSIQMGNDRLGAPGKDPTVAGTEPPLPNPDIAIVIGARR